MGGDVTVLEDEIVTYDDGTVARVRVLSVPRSDRFPEGVKYAFHYGEAGADEPVIRFDNHHGPHELHIGGELSTSSSPGSSRSIERGALHSRRRNDHDPHTPHPDRNHSRPE